MHQMTLFKSDKCLVLVTIRLKINCHGHYTEAAQLIDELVDVIYLNFKLHIQLVVVHVQDWQLYASLHLRCDAPKLFVNVIALTLLSVAVCSEEC